MVRVVIPITVVTTAEELCPAAGRMELALCSASGRVGRQAMAWNCNSQFLVIEPALSMTF
jgi:hypothetical protein